MNRADSKPNRRSLLFQRQADLLSWGVFVAALVVCVWSLRLVWDVGWLPGGFLAAGMFLVWGGINLFHRQLIQPLHDVVERIQTMGETKCWSRLAPVGQPDLQALATGFNLLVEQLDMQQRRLKDQIIDLQQANEELDQLANIKDDFLQTVNHQFRTPLTTVIEALSLLQDPQSGALSAEQQSYLGLMRENASRLKELMEEMLDLSMLKSGRRPLARQAEDLGPLLKRCCSQWQQNEPSRKILLELPELPPVYMDAKAVEEVIHHVLRNALRHAPAESPVDVKTSVNHSMVAVSVHNHGPGLNAGQVKRLFEPFAHLHTPHAPGSQGSGLGLAFCRQVVERHGGAISVESTPSAGTTVTVKLPLASPTFMLVDAFRLAKEEAEPEGSFGFCLVASPAPEALGKAEAVLRKNTHRGDRFVRLDGCTLVIVAVADEPGLSMMMRRLRKVLEAAQLALPMAAALFPRDGDQPERLVEAARQRFSKSTA